MYIVNAMNCSHMLARDAEGRKKKNHACTCMCVHVYVRVGLFDAFDENSDGQLDLAEMVRAVGWCCRSIDHRRHKCECHLQP